MRHRFWIALAGFVVLLGIITPLSIAAGNEGPSAATSGDRLLQAGDFPGAFRAYAEAVRADSENQEYRQRYAILRQVISLREKINQEQDLKRWDQFARALHAFYRSEGILGEALKIGQQLHAKQATPETAIMLADVQLELGMNDNAAELLSVYSSGNSSNELRALYGIALARQGNREQAAAQLERVKLPEGAAPALCYHVARLQVLTGGGQGAQQTLARAFSATPPSQQVLLKKRVQKCPDFAALIDSPEFAQVLATPSQVKESDCSRGPSCGGCPRARACPSSKGSTQETEKPGVVTQ
jgi:tetratricopeptide (TPR) repeat protein